MNVRGSSLVTTHTPVPFDLAASERETGWRDSLRWPVALSEERAVALGIADRLLSFMRSLDDGGERDDVVVAVPAVLNVAATLCLAALAVERAEQSGIVLAGGPSEIAFLDSGSGDGHFDTPMQRHPPVRARWPVLRHVARTASWTPAWRLPRALLRPDATAVTHNPILRAYARSGRVAVCFRQAERILDAAGVPSDPIVSDTDSDLAARLVDTLLSPLALEESRRARLALLLKGRVSVTIAKVGAELRAVSEWRGLPREIWLGSAGRMPARIIAVAVRRRGGHVTGFDHGGGLFMGESRAGIFLKELAAVDRVVVATEEVARLGQRALSALPPKMMREVLPAEGDPTFRRIRIGKPVRTRIQRVLYLPSTLRGFRTLVPPLLPDVIALDWQMRLAQMLSQLSIELAVRPHPESLLPGLRHPAAQAFTPLVDEPFHRTVSKVGLFRLRISELDCLLGGTVHRPARCMDRSRDGQSVAGDESCRGPTLPHRRDPLRRQKQAPGRRGGLGRCGVRRLGHGRSDRN